MYGCENVALFKLNYVCKQNNTGFVKAHTKKNMQNKHIWMAFKVVGIVK
jgi:hypothetical protein